MEMPDVAPAPSTAFEPIPHAGSSEIVGLLEYLDARGGREDVFRIATDTGRDFGSMMTVVNAAELLDLVDTPRRTVLLSPCGLRFVRAEPEQRKALWREQIMGLQLFRHVHAALQNEPRHRLGREFVLELIAVTMPTESYDAVFESFVSWARFGDLFWYDEEADVLGLQH
jgi:NitT/TauT family transport system ATP-binding protein